jgi:cytochrome c oxidase subunit 2
MLEKFEKRIIITAAALLMIFLFFLMYAVGRFRTDLPACVPYDKAYTHPHITQLDDSTYQVFMVARMWSFEPAQIYLPVGSEVDFYVTSLDVVHGFDISSKNINMMAEYGGIAKSSARFSEPGVYTITCHEYCGAGHQAMQAEIIVNYPTKR